MTVRHRQVTVDGIEIFYREAGPEDAPVLLLLHGFPSSSHMFRHLLPQLQRDYRLIAPDYPGFGQSEFPSPAEFSYTFENLAGVMQRFIRTIRLDRYALYIQDYGAPVGLRLALADPERITGLVVQNGNAYEEGLSRDWDPLRDYWRHPTQANRERLRTWLDPEGIRQQYVAGVPDRLLQLFSPDTWTLDWARLSRPGNLDAQLDLFYDYRTNLELYPAFHEFFRRFQPPTLIVWGRHDPFFTVAGAEAFRRDLPAAELHYLDTGHFALETHCEEIATLIHEFMGRQVVEGNGSSGFAAASTLEEY
ncbi:MAG TPA: alpha/beta hydrolase [Gemmatimonadales bacterium]|nr:alpha/beta hydrolase [Gemmatimonadales bacterium]